MVTCHQHTDNRKSLGMTGRAAELRTARLRLRRVEPGDLDAIHAIMADPETMRFWSSPPHSSREETAKWLGSMIEADRSGASDEFVLELDGKAIGKLGVWRWPEIGFFLRRDHWGQGLASEALAGFIAYATACGADCLTADVDPHNGSCLKMLRNAGFIETGRAEATYMVGDRVCDSIYLRLDLPGRSLSELP